MSQLSIDDKTRRAMCSVQQTTVHVTVISQCVVLPNFLLTMQLVVLANITNRTNIVLHTINVISK